MLNRCLQLDVKIQHWKHLYNDLGKEKEKTECELRQIIKTQSEEIGSSKMKSDEFEDKVKESK